MAELRVPFHVESRSCLPVCSLLYLLLELKLEVFPCLEALVTLVLIDYLKCYYFEFGCVKVESRKSRLLDIF